MTNTQWVQHISGQGEKWEVCSLSTDVDWAVSGKRVGTVHHLPKSEYRICDPPEEWRDVTGDVTIQKRGSKEGGFREDVVHDGVILARLCCGGLYRIGKRLVESNGRSRWLFYVEQKVQP